MMRKTRELKEELERAKRYEKIYKDEVESLRARVKELESGGRCAGGWCEFCENAGREELSFRNGLLTSAKRQCLLDVPCTEFVRRSDDG